MKLAKGWSSGRIKPSATNTYERTARSGRIEPALFTVETGAWWRANKLSEYQSDNGGWAWREINDGL